MSADPAREAAMFTYKNLHRRYAAMVPDGARCVEVGCWTGRSTAHLYDALAATGKAFTLYAVDIWECPPDELLSRLCVGRDLYAEFKATLGARPVVATNLPSVLAAAEHDDASLDFVFIDADHAYRSVKADLSAWLPKVKPGGVLAGHDWPMPSVKRAVREALPAGEVEVIGPDPDAGRSNYCWWWRKPATPTPPATPPAGPSVRAYVVTCEARRETLARTLASLRASDWGEEPAVFVDRLNLPDRRASLTANALRALEAAAADGADYALLLEDDVEFNRHLRHNLLRWPPVRLGYLLAGSLYNPGVAGFAGVGRAVHWGAHHVLLDTDEFYGAQAMLLSRAFVRECVAHWDEVEGMPDIKFSRLAGRFCHAMPCHLPNLVQHASDPSTWGGHPHRSREYDPAFRAGP